MSRSRFRSLAALSVSAALALSGFAVPVAVAADVASSIVINEVEANGSPDWVELANTNTDEDIDISGWSILDDDDTHTPIVIPENTKIESGGYYIIHTKDQTPDGSDGFGLGGKKDQVRLFDASKKLIGETSWDFPDKIDSTWGRVPDMTGSFAVTGEATKQLKNEGVAGEEEPDAPEQQVEPWPYDQVYNVDLGGDFSGEDMSGVDFDDNGRAWVVNNGSAKLYALDYDKAAKKHSLAATWTLKYADGTGTPDAEGVTVGPDGAIYVATERNNDDKKVSRPSVLRFEAKKGQEELKATTEWILKDVVGDIKPNSGLEAISYIPEQKLFAVGVEADGKVYFLDLKEDGTYELKQTYQSPFGGVMALDYRQQEKQLHVLCDEACDGQSILLSHNGTEFVPASGIQARPAGFANLANEGFASFTSTGECVAGKAEETTRFLWADDGVTGGISLRGAEYVKSVDCDGETNGSSMSKAPGGVLIGSIVGVLLAFLAGLLSAGPIAQWVQGNLNIKLPF